MGYKRVGVELDEALYKKARIKCIESDITFADYIRQLIEEDLNKKSTH